MAPSGKTTPPAFKPSLVKKLVLQHQGDTKRVIKKDATLAAGELLRQFILEARSRALIEAECDMSKAENGKALIRPDHITKIAAELLMDFS
jgi:CENP-S associating Centromere protein X